MSTLATMAAAAPLTAAWTAHAMWMRHRLTVARRDPLTGLPTRAAFTTKARRTLTHPSAVIVIDLDGFKTLNDTHGHAAGDAALRTIGHRLTTWTKATGGTVARLGGDEFAAVVPCDRPAFLTDGLEVLHASLAEPLSYEGRAIQLGASIGAIWHDGHPSAGLPVLLRRADEAMYDIKRIGGGYLIAHGATPVHATANGRRAGRDGTTNPERDHR